MPAKRIYWLDGLKGLSCLFIFFTHFCLWYFPATCYGSAETSHLNGFDTFLADSPLGIIVNGNFFVHLFILISGYVITYQVISMKHEKLGFFLFKRYLKLIFPLAIYTLVVLCMRFFKHFGKEHFARFFAKELYNAIDSLFIRILFKGDKFLGGHLWMLNYIFVGGILVAIISSLCWTFDAKKVTFVPAVIGFALFLHPTLEYLHFAPIFLGSALCMFNAFYTPPRTRNFLIILLLFVALFFAAFPTGIPKRENISTIYKYFYFPVRGDHSRYYWHTFGAFFIIFSISKLDSLQNFFSKSIFKYLAKISMWVYLFHGIMVSFAKSIMDFFHIQNYIAYTASIFFVTCFFILISSHFLATFVSPLGNKIVAFIERNLQKNESENPYPQA